MGVIVVSKELDPRFVDALQALDRSEEWKRFALAGRMVGELAADFGDGRPMPEGPRVGPAEDLRAWLWGRDWTPEGPPPPVRPGEACAECWRLGEACAEHPRSYERLWWLSYADESGSRGVCVVGAESFLQAAARARTLGISPGGEVRGFEVPAEERGRLERFEGKHLTASEARALA